MAEPATAATPHYLKTPDAAIHLGLSARTLEKHRCYGTGPVFRRLGGRIVYAIEDLDAWAALGTRRSTSDPGNGVFTPRSVCPPTAYGADGRCAALAPMPAGPAPSGRSSSCSARSPATSRREMPRI